MTTKTTSRFTIERRITERECFHPMCYEMHRRFIISGNNGVHYVEEIVYAVIDEETGRDIETYDRRKDAAWKVADETERIASYQARKEAKTIEIDEAEICTCPNCEA